MSFVHFKLQDRIILQKGLKDAPTAVLICGCVLAADCFNLRCSIQDKLQVYQIFLTLQIRHYPKGRYVKYLLHFKHHIFSQHMLTISHEHESSSTSHPLPHPLHINPHQHATLFHIPCISVPIQIPPSSTSLIQ